MLDCVQKAAVVAPSKAGAAFDKAAGIVFNINPGVVPVCVVQATNLDSFYIESIDVVTAEGASTRWRLPNMLAKVLDAIPKAPGKTVKFTKDPTTGRVKIESGRMRATLGLIDVDFYPEFEMYEGEFSTTSGVGVRIEQVAWACGKAGTEPLTGVHFTGQHVIATDRYRVARVPLHMPISSPITVPAGMLATILKRNGSVDVGATEHQVVFKVHDGCHVYSAIYASPYPAIEKRVTGFTYDGEVRVRKAEFAGLITLATSVVEGDRMPLLQLIIGRSEIAAFMNGQEAGIGDVLDAPGQASHPRISLYFNPGYLLDAINKAPGDNITFSYQNKNESMQPVKVADGSGYEAWIAARKSTNDGEA